MALEEKVNELERKLLDHQLWTLERLQQQNELIEIQGRLIKNLSEQVKHQSHLLNILSR